MSVGPGSAGPKDASVRALAEAGAVGLVRAAVATLRERRRPLLGVAALFVVPIEVLQAYLLRDVPPDAEVEAAAVLFVFALAYTLVVAPLLATALLRGALERLTGGETTVEELARVGGRWIPPVLLVSVLYGLAVAAGAVALLLPGIYLAVRFYVATSAVVVERRRGLEAMRRSWRLTGGRVGRTLGTVFVGFVALLVVVLLPGALLVEALADIWLAAGLLSGLLTSVAAAFAFALESVLYVHLRAHHDLEFDEWTLRSDLEAAETR